MESSGFWKGVVVGGVAGVALARLLGEAQRPGTQRNALTAMERRVRRNEISLKRDDGGGDPSLLTAARTGANAGFERAGGAPGGASRPESSEVPGHPGSQIDYTDPSEAVTTSSRTIDLRPRRH